MHSYTKKRQYTVKIADMEWTARTKREAQEKRDAYLEKLLGDGFAPILKIFDDCNGFLVYRNEHGWAYSLINRGGVRNCVCSGFDSRSQAEEKARYHLAQNIVRPQDETTINNAVGILESSSVTENTRNEFDSWIQWQVRYGSKKADGGTDEECRAYADGR